MLRGAAYSALMALIAAYCAVLLSLPPQDDASNHAADIAGWIFLGAAMAILAWFTYRYSALAHKCRDRVLSEAEKTRQLIALAKYKRTLVDK